MYHLLYMLQLVMIAKMYGQMTQQLQTINNVKFND